MKPTPPRADTPAQKRELALRAAIARCRDLMRQAKQRGDMTLFQSYLKQTYALQQQMRNATRGVKKGG